MPSSLSAISIHKQLSLSQGQQGEGVNIRNPSTALLGVSSIDRYNYPGGEPSELGAGQINPSQNFGNPLSSPYDFSISTNANFLDGYFTRLAVNEIQFRYTLPTLTSRNNKIYFNLSPLGTSTFSGFTSSGGNVTLNVASSTGYVSGQNVAIGGVPSYTTGGVTYNLNGVWTITSVTATTIVISVGVPSTYPSSTGNIAIQYLLTLPEGWYDLTDVATTGAGTPGDGNLAYQVQVAVRSANPTYAGTFTALYNLNTSASTLGAPYNCFLFASGNTSTFYFPVTLTLRNPIV
jgi:hypothetical protein